MIRLPAGQRMRVACTVNGAAKSGHAEGRTLLSDFLRHELHLYGTHVGCEHGVCGAPSFSTVGWHAHAPRSPFKPTVPRSLRSKVWRRIKASTVLREAFFPAARVQCGFCTPGVLVYGALPAGPIPIPTKKISVRCFRAIYAAAPGMKAWSGPFSSLQR